MLQILHITDSHIGQTKREAVNLVKVVNYIMDHFFDDRDHTVIIHTGDVVDNGQKKEYAKARKVLDRLYQHFRVWAVPGNHDYGWNGTHAQSKRFKYFKSALYGLENVTYPHVKQVNEHVFIGLNSMKAETDGWDGLLADGELGSKQLKNLNGVLNQLDGRKKKEKVILHLHHHPFIYPDEKGIEGFIEKKTHWLKDGEALMSIIANRVDILLFGHDHRHLDFSNSLGKKYGIPLILAGGKCTEYKIEYKVDKNGEATKEKENNGQKGLMGRLIKIEGAGKPTAKTIVFDKK